MKIIGQTAGGFILDATKDEVHNLIGYYSQAQYSGDNAKLMIGDSIQVADMYKQLYQMNSHDEKVSVLINDFRRIADELELVRPVVQKVTGKSAG